MNYKQIHTYNIYLIFFFNCSCQQDIYCEHYTVIFNICKKRIIEKVPIYWTSSELEIEVVNSYADFLATELYMSLIHCTQQKCVEYIQSHNTEIGNKQNPHQNLLEQRNIMKQPNK